MFETVFGIGGASKVFTFCKETTEHGHDFHARMFAPKMGIQEDPATGSAVAAFAGLLAASGRYGDGEHNVPIEDTGSRLTPREVAQLAGNLGITIYTIQMIDGNDSLLKSCASSSDKYFKITSSGQTASVFTQIGTNLSRLRVAK